MQTITSVPVNEMTPQEWLANIRHQRGLRGNFAAPKEWLADLLSRMPESARDEAREIWMGRYKKTMGEVYEETMQDYLHQFLPILRPQEREVAETTFFGIFPTSEFNGYAGRTPRGDRIVILNEGLGYTLAFWSHWYLRIKDEGGRDYLLQDFGKISSALRHILRSWYGYSPDTELPDIYPKTEDSWVLDQCLVFSSIVFVLGHELGHVVANHAEYGPNPSENHELEYEADRIGLAIVIRHALAKAAADPNFDTYHTKFMLFGPLFAISVMSLMGNTSSPTHPSSSERRDRLMSSYAGELRGILGDHFSSFLEMVDDDVLTVLDRNSKRLFETFSRYRELMDDIEIGPRIVDNAWLRKELRAL